MQIDDLAGNTVKITLEPSDMSGYHVRSEDISGHSRAAELAISRLILHGALPVKKRGMWLTVTLVSVQQQILWISKEM